MPGELLEGLRVHARATYPDEACGFLFASPSASSAPVRPVGRAERAANEFAGEQRRRFVISPDELRAAEERAASRGEVVAGFYHSHPDHPALPSTFDSEHAWPWYAYVIISVDGTGTCREGAFELPADGGPLSPRRLEVGAGPSRVPVAGAAPTAETPSRRA